MAETARADRVNNEIFLALPIGSLDRVALERRVRELGRAPRKSA